MLRHINTIPKKPKRVVVMGAGGFVGAALVDRLNSDGIPVLVLTRKDVDLLEKGASEKLATLIEPEDAFVAVSALAPVKNTEMLIDNLKMAQAMVNALRQRTGDISYVINISSDAVYADAPTPLSETSCKEPGSYHGIMHLAREVMFETELEIPLAHLRPTLIYGANDPHNGYGPNRFRRMAAEGEDISLFGEGEERRDHVLIDDVAELIVRMLMQKSEGSLNAVTGDVWSFREIAAMVVDKFETPVQISGSPRQGEMPHGGYRPFDASATAQAFPDFTYTTLPEGLAKVHAETQR